MFAPLTILLLNFFFFFYFIIRLRFFSVSYNFSFFVVFFFYYFIFSLFVSVCMFTTGTFVGGTCLSFGWFLLLKILYIRPVIQLNFWLYLMIGIVISLHIHFLCSRSHFISFDLFLFTFFFFLAYTVATDKITCATFD